MFSNLCGKALWLAVPTLFIKSLINLTFHGKGRAEALRRAHATLISTNAIRGFDDHGLDFCFGIFQVLLLAENEMRKDGRSAALVLRLCGKRMSNNCANKGLPNFSSKGKKHLSHPRPPRERKVCGENGRFASVCLIPDSSTTTIGLLFARIKGTNGFTFAMA